MLEDHFGALTTSAFKYSAFWSMKDGKSLSWIELKWTGTLDLELVPVETLGKIATPANSGSDQNKITKIQF